VLDYSGDHAMIGKNVGDDLAEGKPTLPLIYAIENGSREQATLVREAIKRGGLDDLGAVLEIIRSTGALEYAREQAQAESRLACEGLDCLQNSKHRDYLLQLAEFAVTRDY
jgi:octaprenyl-diphosphate synthase